MPSPPEPHSGPEAARALLLAVIAALLVTASGFVYIRTTDDGPVIPRPPADSPAGSLGSASTELHWGSVGSDGQWWWSNGSWRDRAGGAPSLHIAMHDGSVGWVTYRPNPAGTRGLFYLGSDPGEYFGDERSVPVDTADEAAGFATWVRGALGRQIPAASIEALLAAPGREPRDVFVEETADRLLTLVGLPPPTLPGAPLV